ncbi:NfeD family protein [Edaphobacillus lindanitolerans]|uniref:Membrane-bound serine protease (ClpP class) n=1 Tax=Edaphobacillus lindanitolerans TaxID=550447 RepID=A0A1U7PQ08_9BACI|nr:nodulation protein NfeD [Edaphobacillus lindanitolerans]SIT82390.1 membrane-bound serine protease (ClpP class) [Edaphobacillus lindanitolerans]
MKAVRFVRMVLLLVAAVLLFAPAAGAKGKTVFHVPLENEVERGLYEFLERSIAEAEKAGADTVILEINTPGGFVDAAGKIAKLMDNANPKIIAYINRDALSAGAFLALHADEIYMDPSGRIGAAQVIDQSGNAADTKADSAWRTAMQNAAESSDQNRDPKYALAMADPDQDLPEYRAGKGQLLTLSAKEAEKVGYSEGTVSSFDELLEKTGLSGAEVVNMTETFSEKLARFITNPVVVPILLSIAGLGLIVELYSPGFGVPGTMGVSAILLFFYGHLVAGLAGYEAILLFVLGIGLLVAELFVSGGILGVAGAAAVVGGIIMAGGDPLVMGVSVAIALVIMVMGMVILMKFFGKRLHLLSKLVLMDSTDTESGYVSNKNRLELIGRKGVSLTALRPSGAVRLDNEMLDVVTEGSFIEKDKEVQVIKVEGSRIVVREVKAD